MIAKRPESLPILLLFSLHCLEISNAFSTRQIHRKSQLARHSARILPEGQRQRTSKFILHNDETNSEETSEKPVVGISEKTIAMGDIIQTTTSDDATALDDDINYAAATIPEIEVQMAQLSEQEMEECMLLANESSSEKPSLSPKAVLRFIAPTLALWIAPPVMSLIDTSAVGRFCGANDLAGMVHCRLQILASFHKIRQ